MLWLDSNAWEIDAFSSSWAHLYVYAFAPFAILKRTLRTLEEDQVTAIHPRLLQHPQLPHLSHPNVKTMRLTVWPISGSVSSQEVFQMKLSPSSFGGGPPPHTGSMKWTSKNGRSFAYKGNWSLGGKCHKLPLLSHHPEQGQHVIQHLECCQKCCFSTALFWKLLHYRRVGPGQTVLQRGLQAKTSSSQLYTNLGCGAGVTLPQRPWTFREAQH